MYLVYLDHVLFPVAPERIVTETKNKNTVYSLIDGSFVLAPGGKELRRISFDLLLPMSEYPFALYQSGFVHGGWFVDELNRIAAENKPVWFDVYRSFPDMKKTYLTNMLVVPEEITIVEDAKNGMDMVAKVVLREYRSVETLFAAEKVKNDYTRRENNLEVAYTYEVKSGDSLWLIAKKMLGDGAKYSYLAEINGIKPPYVIYTGQVIKLRE